MHVSSFTSPLSLDPTSNSDSYNSPNNNFNSYYNKPNNNNLNLSNYLTQFLITALILGLGFLLQLFRYKYFKAAAAASMSAGAGVKKGCAVCGEPSKLWCSACKIPYYCSPTCQSKHWKSEHKANCKRSSSKLKPQQHKNEKRNSSIALVPLPPDKIVDKVLFSYDEFIKLFNWDLPTYAPCGLINCGNSCFANVVLQCLAHTRPLMAYLLKKGHRRDCRRSKWCFLCEFEAHVERAINAQEPFSPINILSHLPTMGGNMGYGKQQDAHEFMRFAVDMMQSVCLDKHGGEKLVLPKSQETTLIQHIFGGQLRSQVKCRRCGQVSDRYENMMDLLVEMHGDVTSLQECLDQFTEREWLDGDNKYKCDRCKDYVTAIKRLTIHHAPNILTVTLKRFQGGNFGKLDKKVAISEILDLCPFMSGKRDGSDIYELYAVVVHIDMLNASFFGHYICYTKGFQGDWYWIDDRKVIKVDIDEVLSQGAYMLMYKRISARPKCLKTSEVGMNKECEGDKRASTVADDISRSQLPSTSNSSDLYEREGDKMTTVADNISPSQIPSSSNSSDPCMDTECDGNKMATVADDISPSQLPSSSNSFTTTDEKKQLEPPLVPLSLAVREAIDRVSEYAYSVLPMSDECKLSEPVFFNKNQLMGMDPKGESSDADQVDPTASYQPRYSINGSVSLPGQRIDKKNKSD